MAQITWTEEAEHWLRKIHDYIADDNPTAAQRTIEGIYKKAQMLRKSPRLGLRYEDIEDREVRILLYGHYRVAYLIKPDENIEILGVFHGAMEIERYLE